ncbi:MAG: hypothetical protein JWO13_1317 [Acidobacteriales bacterium]|nr:hypothetical protein [Terriglobales bacterium]
MKISRFSLVIALACTVAANIAMAAQDQPKAAYANIPFEFWVTGTKLPAGEYRFEHVESTTTVLIRNNDGTRLSEAYMMPLNDDAVSPNNSKVVFLDRGGNKYLYEFWGVRGKRVVTAEIPDPPSSGSKRIEVAVLYK